MGQNRYKYGIFRTIRRFMNNHLIIKGYIVAVAVEISGDAKKRKGRKTPKAKS